MVFGPAKIFMKGMVSRVEKQNVRRFSMKSNSDSYERAFSHIYIEQELIDSPMSDSIISRLPESIVIPITHYKDVFNKTGQNPAEQSVSRKLILASNKGRKVYEGAPYCHDFGHSSFFYTSQVLNCPFDCSYCYLKGKFPSANIVAFLNTDDYFRELTETTGGSDAFVTLSYDSDMAALEPMLKILQPWYRYIQEHPSMTFELRTKSLFMPDTNPIPNLITAVSLLPQPVIDEYETFTPSLAARLVNIRRLMNAGFQVRLAIDPILEIDNTETIYETFIENIAQEINLNSIIDISAGCFRIPSDYLKNMASGYGNHFIHCYPFDTADGHSGYAPEKEAGLLKAVTGPLMKYIDKTKIYTR